MKRIFALCFLTVAAIAYAASGDFLPGGSTLPGPKTWSHTNPVCVSNPNVCWRATDANAYRDALNDLRDTLTNMVTRTVAPTLNTITTPTNVNPIPVSGASVGGATIRIKVDGVVQATTTATSGGTYSVNVPRPDPGTYVFTATAQVTGSTESTPSAGQTIVVTSPPPPIGTLMFSPPGAVYGGSQTVSISATGGTLYYSTDNSDPSIPYVGPITVTSTMAVRARATTTNPSYSSTAISENLYIIDPPSMATSIIPPDRLTVWSPGVPGGIPDAQTVFTTIDASACGYGASDCTTLIQTQLDSAAGGAVPRSVLLGSGTFRVDGTLYIHSSNVVLRGQGVGTTRLLKNPTTYGDFIVIGNFPSYSPAIDVVADPITGLFPKKGDNRLTLASVTNIKSGDQLILDRLDDPNLVVRDVVNADGTPGASADWWKRGPGNGPSGYADSNGPVSPDGYRSMGQILEVQSVSGSIVTIQGVLHFDYPTGLHPQVFKATTPVIRTSGIQDMTVAGWGETDRGPSTGIAIISAQRCWVKNVEVDGLYVPSDPDNHPGMEGQGIRVDRCVRCEIRESMVHHSLSYNTNRHAYGVTITMQTSDTLIEDNIVWFLNKNIMLEASGSGNVIGYNFVSDGQIDYAPGWQEMHTDGSHLSHPHMDLFEGNWTTSMGAAETHGTSSHQTFFRNYAPGKSMTLGDVQGTNRRGVKIDARMKYHSVVGNVLLFPGVETADPGYGYEGVPATPTTPWPYEYSWGSYTFIDAYWLGGWAYGSDARYYDPNVAALLLRHGNYDYATGTLLWDSGNSDHVLPNSLYLRSKPAFFGSNTWPWVDPEAATSTTRVKTCPAVARFQAMSFQDVAKPPYYSPPNGTPINGSSVIVASSITPGATITCCEGDSCDPLVGVLDGAALSYGGTSFPVTFRCVATAGGFYRSAITSAQYLQLLETTASPPIFSPGPGSYSSSQSVTLSSGTLGATIYYTLDGSDPTTASSVYSTSISVGEGTTTIKSFVHATGYYDSAIASAVYSVTLPPVTAAPTCSPTPGSYSATQDVVLATTTVGATIHYTTDNSDPTSGSPTYVSTVSVPASLTIKAYATADGHTDSSITSCSYTIIPASGPYLVGTYTNVSTSDSNPRTVTGINWTNGDLIVIGFSDNWEGQNVAVPATGACTIPTVGGTPSCTLRNNLYHWNSTIAHAATWIWTYATTGDGTNQTVSIAGDTNLNGLMTVWVVRRPSGTVLPAADDAPYTVGTRAMTTKHYTDGSAAPAQDMAITLTGGTQCSANSMVFGIGTSYLGGAYWGNNGNDGAARAALSGDSIDAQNHATGGGARSVSFHKVSQCAGSTDYTIGTTSTDPLVYGNAIVVEVQ